MWLNLLLYGLQVGLSGRLLINYLPISYVGFSSFVGFYPITHIGCQLTVILGLYTNLYRILTVLSLAITFAVKYHHINQLREAALLQYQQYEFR